MSALLESALRRCGDSQRLADIAANDRLMFGDIVTLYEGYTVTEVREEIPMECGSDE